MSTICFDLWHAGRLYALTVYKSLKLADGKCNLERKCMDYACIDLGVPSPPQDHIKGLDTAQLVFLLTFFLDITQ